MMHMNNGTINYDSLIAYSIMPLITSGSINIVSKFLDNIGLLIMHIIEIIASFFTVYILKKQNEYSKVYIPLTSTNTDNYFPGSSSAPTFNDISIPFVWYLNKKRGKSVGNVRLYKYTQNNKMPNLNHHNMLAIDKCDEQPNFEYIFAPTSDDIIENKNNNNFNNNFNNDFNNNNRQKIEFKKKSTQYEIDKNIFIEHSIVNKNEYIVVLSKHHSVSELISYLQNIKQEYDKYTKSKTLQIFSFSGKTEKKYHICPIDKSQTFENLYFSKKESMLNLLTDFDNIEKYKKYGMKRKLSFCFVGKPGSGKTAIVSAMANMLNRNIVYIPISRVRNNDLETMFYENTYNGVKYDFNEVIFFFDEIDSLNKKLTKDIESEIDEQKMIVPNINIFTEKDNKIPDFNELKDELNTGILLNLLDGNYEQDGMIIIAAANDITKLDSAFVRNGRLKFFELEYVGRNEIVQMIEDYMNIKLSRKQKNMIRDDKIIQTLDIKECIIENNDVEKIINIINEMKTKEE